MMNHLTFNRVSKFGTAALLSMTLMLAGAPLAPAKTAQAASVTSSKAQTIIATAETYMHRPYRFGSPTGSTSTFDCSSFVWTAFHSQGIDLPRSSSQMSKVGQYVSKSQLQPGDLVFFYSPIHHVGIYIGGGKVIHTFGKPGVTISDINSGWWNNNYTTARRVL
ncbi:C40 family peptidase [Paenibacillus filicis]|uniref:C40 family peptidase n=1 Tax=Paenibacillus gyeongsangnamensis TaxID=3388067 RepID=A0ABT4QGL6_9BACL|nr:C40 family peptidase [Paenibacillus filicis]MCZ8515999.1 C40 family peptidase [Paenibacillus filicis]